MFFFFSHNFFLMNEIKIIFFFIVITFFNNFKAFFLLFLFKYLSNAKNHISTNVQYLQWFLLSQILKTKWNKMLRWVWIIKSLIVWPTIVFLLQINLFLVFSSIIKHLNIFSCDVWWRNIVFPYWYLKSFSFRWFFFSIMIYDSISSWWDEFNLKKMFYFKYFHNFNQLQKLRLFIRFTSFDVFFSIFFLTLHRMIYKSVWLMKIPIFRVPPTYIFLF